MAATQTPVPTDRPAPRIAGITSRRRTRLLIAALTVAAAILVWTVPRHTDTQSENFGAGVEQLVVDVNGRVSIAAGDRTEVVLTREWGWLGAPATTLDRDGGMVRVEGRCGPARFLAARCLTHASATVATGAEVVVTTSSGAIEVTGTTRGVDLKSSAGRIQVNDVAGPARLHSSAGAITGVILGGDVDARSSAGAITLEITDDVRQVSATSSAGAIDLTVPDHQYRVDFDTSAGSVDLDVRTDPDATRRITARSSAGDITIHRAER